MPEPNQARTGQPQPLWLPVNDVARPRLGMSPELLLSAVEAGQLPLRIASYGRRGLKFVNRADVERLEAQEGGAS